MTAAQRQTFSELLEALGGPEALTIPDRIRVEVLACLLVEVRALQAFTNQHGTTYEVTGTPSEAAAFAGLLIVIILISLGILSRVTGKSFVDMFRT